ncbi:hypothetical protein I9H08_25285 [Pseudomonas syringae pv. syringae]|uniref:hypothetical protein n=1 Tax=Pseudomonas syringae TaxID=317 RepID=UPI00101301D7|nr:hypothetical protein [Pseudomonas syringae]MEE1998385.1 hypothetical protein [Pseudomonas syringae pv. syringae]UQB22944.1 hypothetical protein I9H08_25285 [Pseudomonas syringae pv. syringae]
MKLSSGLLAERMCDSGAAQRSIRPEVVQMMSPHARKMFAEYCLAKKFLASSEGTQLIGASCPDRLEALRHAAMRLID